jgi:protocatechuate 3,4-dioxygenase beta subunit
MDNDDKPVGKILNRRDILKLFGLTGAATLAACAPTPSPVDPTPTVGASAADPTVAETPQPTNTTIQSTPTDPKVALATIIGTLPSCIVRPAMTEGPYFVDEKLNRSDVRSDPSDGSVKDGAPLELTFLVSQINGNCTPLAGALVDIWHCDALGVYSDVSDPGFNTQGKKFLRGYQTTDANGMAKFITIYPGWYPGRAVHIHFKIRTSTGQAHEFTSQLFFDDAFSDQVYAAHPAYASKGPHTLLNAQDNIYRNGGSQLLLNVTPTTNGYASTFDIGLNIT